MKKNKLGPKTILYPMPSLLIGSTIQGKPNFMTAAWAGIAAQTPPAISVAIHKSRYTLKGINENGCFSVNVPNSTLIQKVDYCGTHSGSKHDKSKIFKVFYGDLKKAPMVEECPLNIECRVIDKIELESHILIVGEIIETYINEDCLREGKPDPKIIDPLIYATGIRKYCTLGEYVGDAFSIGKEK